MLKADAEIHIAPGPSAGGCLQAGLGLPRELLLINNDVLSCGPLPSLDSLDDWRDVREAYLRSIDREYLPFERRSAHLFFQLVARRYERGSLLITTNQLVTQWGTVFGDEVLAAAILDRLLHHSHTLMIQGDSYRLKQKRKAGLIPAVPHPQGALAGEPARADRKKH